MAKKRGEMHVRFWWENLEILLGTSRRNVKILEEEDVREWVGLIPMYKVTYSLVPKMRAVSLTAQELLRSQERICSVELVRTEQLLDENTLRLMVI
jgi:hypothetical protein